MAWCLDPNALPVGRVQRDPCHEGRSSVEISRKRVGPLAPGSRSRESEASHAPANWLAGSFARRRKFGMNGLDGFAAIAETAATEAYRATLPVATLAS